MAAPEADAVPEDALEHYRKDGRRLMAELAAVNTTGGRHAYARRMYLLDIDRTLDRYNMLRLLEVGWMLALPERDAS